MRSTAWLLFLLAATLTAALGCSDDSTAPAPPSTSTGLLEGQIGDADFEISVDATGNAHRRWEGPFALRGTNLHYEDSLQALVVDLTVTNRGRRTYGEPIGLTFLKLLPDSVTVLNPDNGIHGAGAAIVFAFANDDSLWTPGETSLPHTVQFGVAKGTSIGFIARLDIGEPTIEGGSIAGRVWNDTNQDGVMDPDERGIPGALVVLRSGEESSNIRRRLTRTDRNGLYAFNRLRAGMYVVSRPPSRFMKPTTPSEITVLLTEVDGDVSDFTDANFGCLLTIEPPSLMGVFVRVGGEYLTDPDRIEAKQIELRRCKFDSMLTSGDDGVGNGGDVEDCAKGRLRGPVTSIDEANSQFAVMGTLISTDPASFPTELEVGDRVDVGVHRMDNTGGLVADEILEWSGENEQVHGRVEKVEVVEGVIQLRVVDTLVILKRDPSLFQP